MICPIITFGHEVLRKKAEPVVVVDETIRTLVKDLLETMYAAKGLGLAAEQIGRTESICVIDVPADVEKETCREANAALPMPLILINPEILSREGKQRNDEGCLSFPEIGAPITRANYVTVTFLDIAGTRQTVTACGLLSRAIQHEIDHLNGILLVDKMSPLQRLSVSGQLKRLQTRGQ